MTLAKLKMMLLCAKEEHLNREFHECNIRCAEGEISMLFFERTPAVIETSCIVKEEVREGKCNLTT